MVGSMRPSTAVSADGPLNLLQRGRRRADPNAKGEACCRDERLDPRRAPVTKTSTTAVVDFHDRRCAALVRTCHTASSDFYTTPDVEAHGAERVRHFLGDQMPRVDIIYAYVDAPATPSPRPSPTAPKASSSPAWATAT
jgi:L-asparaginase